MIQKTAPLLACLALAACGGGPASNPTTRASGDPIVLSTASLFRAACIRTAPEFEDTRVRAALDIQSPRLAPGMTFHADHKPGKRCRVTVEGYGDRRPAPTAGDIDGLARSLETALGGVLVTSAAEGGEARVKAGRKGYDVTGYVARNGDLTFAVTR